MSVNKCIFVGNLGKDPEIRTTQQGGKIANFTIAVSDRWKDKKSGEQRERTTWVPIVIFNEHLVTVAERFLHKGSKVYVEGEFTVRKWSDKDGNDRYSTEIVLNRFKGGLQMLDSKSSYGGQDSHGGTVNDPARQGPYNDDLDSEEVPF